MVHRIYLLSLLVTGLCIQSCSQKNSFTYMESKEGYTSHLQSLSDTRFKKQVQEDAELLSAVIDSISGFSFYYAIGFGFGDGSNSSQVDTAQTFSLPSKDSIVRDFNDRRRQLYFEQTIALPSSIYGISAGYKAEAFDYIAADDLKYDIQKVFVKGKEIIPNQLKLRQADSLLVKATYKYPLHFDSLTIPANENEITYGNYTLNINESQDNRMVFTVPLQLSNRVLDYRGVTADGTLIKSNSFSKFPITEIDAELLNILKNLRKSLASGDKSNIMKTLEDLPDGTMQHLRQLESLHQDYLEYEQMTFEDDFEEIAHMRNLAEKYAPVLGVNDMQYEISFPNTIKDIQLYVAQEYDSISRNFTVRNLLTDRPKYNVFLDKDKNKYGIVDDQQNIIIPATYNKLLHRSNLFFMERKESEFYTYLLDPKKKEFQALPKGLVFNSELKANDATYYLFADSNRNMGVFNKNLEEVLPFEFDNGLLCGNIFVMDRNHRGRIYKEFYTKEGKRIELPEKVRSVSCNEGAIIIINRLGRSGALNKEGEMTIPMKYQTPYNPWASDRLMKYQEKIDDKQSYFSGESLKIGLIDVQTGKVIVPAQQGFREIGYFNDGLAAASVRNNYETRMGYINEQGGFVISPKFDYGTDFHNGKACVRTQDNKIHFINTKGQIIKTFPDRPLEEGYTEPRNYGSQSVYDDKIYYEINTRYYGENGELLSPSMIEKIQNNS